MAKHIYLPQDERIELEQQIKSGKHSARVLSRARVILLLDRSQGQARTIGEVAEAALVSISGVNTIKKRYLMEGLERALYDKPRPGRPVTKMTGEVEAHLISLTCSDPPDGQDQWTLRLLADRLVELDLVESISHVAVGKTLKKTNSNRGV
jgi:transposase